MKYFIASLLLLLSMGAKAAPFSFSQETRRIMAQLDSILPLREQFEQNKLKRINALKNEASLTVAYDKILWTNSKLYDEYFTYDSDSAHKYVDRSIEIAQQLNNTDLVAEWKIKKGLLLVNTGLLGQAQELAESIRKDVNPNLLSDYYDLMFALNLRFGQYSDGSPDIQKQYNVAARAYQDSTLMVIRQDHPDYLRLKAGQIQSRESYLSIIAALEHELEHSALSTRQDAMNAISLAYLHKVMNDQDKYIQNLAKSAISDIKATNSDIDSLDELSRALFEMGDLDHAYLYITTCLNIIRTYGNRIHLLRLTAIQEDINKAYIERGQRQHLFVKGMAWTSGVLAIVLLLAICLIIRFMLKQRNSQQELDEKNKLLQENINELRTAQESLNIAHSALEDANAKLVKLNTQLQEANYVKEEYIGYVFSICSNYISKLDEFRKDINRKAKTNLFKEIKEMTDSSTIAQSELKEFYQNFDAIFLNVYPNFVTDFNQLLQPEYQFNLKEGEGLNTELRIFALVKLGITDCVKISEFLHCSAQTVYNYRLRIRNHSLIPDKKEFAEAVQAIGKATVL